MSTRSSQVVKAGFADAIVFALLLFVAALCSGAGTLHGQPTSAVKSPSPEQTYEGVVTDSRCGAKHSSTIGLTAGECTIQCIRMGEQFSLVDAETVYILDGDPQELKRVAGQRVKVNGALNGNKLAVTSIARD